MYSNKWRKNFRHKTFRLGQEGLIENIAKNLDNGKEFVVVEAPTGTGKSDAAMALAKSADQKAYITTTQNILINQYVNDFITDDDFYYIKGKRHYKCCGTNFDGVEYDIDPDNQMNCEEGGDAACLNSIVHGKDGSSIECGYKAARDLAAESKVAFTNLAYYIHGCKNEMIWPMRDLAIHDEAHNIASIVLDNVSFTLKEYYIERLSKYSVPMFPKFKSSSIHLKDSETVAKHKARGYYEIDPVELSEYCAKIAIGLTYFIEQCKTMNLGDRDEIRIASKLLEKISWFMISMDEGIEWIVDHYYGKDSKSQKIVARPLHSGYFCNNMLFKGKAVQHVMQSATIINPAQYMKELGLPVGQNKIQYIRNHSPFDLVKNRPIYPVNTGVMNYKTLDNVLPDIVDDVYRIIVSRPKLKGMVHTNSYKIMEYLEKHLKDSDIGNRCLFASVQNRNNDLDTFMNSTKPLVIFSPSLTEGVDGKYDKLRFQIVCKIPYPYMGDRRIALKMKDDQQWYNYMTAKTLVQTVGRGVRAEDDWCENFILDSALNRFCQSGALPDDFINSINSGHALDAVGRPRR